VAGVCDVATNLAIDDELVCAARDLGHHKTKKEAVTAALEEYVRRRRVEEFLALEGTIDYDEDYDYKAERRRGLDRLLLDEIDASGR
jgi:Arc/MetJ family transcription regulator